jgi:hypothetical protein
MAGKLCVKIGAPTCVSVIRARYFFIHLYLYTEPGAGNKLYALSITSDGTKFATCLTMNAVCIGLIYLLLRC